jgi:hypothetical protein
MHAKIQSTQTNNGAPQDCNNQSQRNVVLIPVHCAQEERERERHCDHCMC